MGIIYLNGTSYGGGGGGGSSEHIQSDWEQSLPTADDYIKNKPELGTASAKDSTNMLISGSTDLIESGVVKDAIDNFVQKTGDTMTGDLHISNHSLDIGYKGENDSVNPAVPYTIGDYSIGQGYSNEHSGQYSSAFGRNNKASGSETHAEGAYNQATGSQSHVEGYNNQTTMTAAHAEGSYNISSGGNSHSEGSHNIASGLDAHAEGYYTQATSSQSHAEGYYTQATSSFAHAEGSNTIAGYSGQHVQGRYNDNKEKNAFEIGNGYTNEQRKNALEVTWDGDLTISGGYRGEGSLNVLSTENYEQGSGGTVIASKWYQPGELLYINFNPENENTNLYQVIGEDWIAQDDELIKDTNVKLYKYTNLSSEKKNAYTVGTRADAGIGVGSVSIGKNLIASSDYSYAEGNDTTASGPRSHAEGLATVASGSQSHAAGTHTVAGYANQFVVGKYNNNQANTLFEVGNGRDSKLSNALEVTGNGDVNVANTLTAKTIRDQFWNDFLFQNIFGNVVDNKAHISDPGIINEDGLIGGLFVQRTSDSFYEKIDYTNIQLDTENEELIFTLNTSEYDDMNCVLLYHNWHNYD